jgi:diguanylate cyclase (GGDEF)-like protein
MYLDVATLTVAGGAVGLCSGVFLLVYWWQDRMSWSALWWALGNSGTGIGVVLLALHSVLPFYASNLMGPLILDFSAVCMFVAARIFNRGSVSPYRVAACVAGWILMLAITGSFIREQYAAALGAGVSGGLIVAAAFEFWSGRSEELPGRKPMIVVVLCYATTLLLVSLQFARMTDYSPVPSMGWLGAVHFAGLAYALGSTLFLIMMLKGRSEENYKIAALVDPLTGLLNRRAFLDRGQRIFDRGGRDESPVALIAFDLDRFKHINDAFGHATGDQVLRAFADVLSATLRPADLAARIGGEEFVAVAPGVSGEAAVAIANRICGAFQTVAQFVDGQKIGATVSAGVATAGGLAIDLADVLANADAALYRAKNAGRNRVVLAECPVELPVSNVIRIA